MSKNLAILAILACACSSPTTGAGAGAASADAKVDVALKAADAGDAADAPTSGQSLDAVLDATDDAATDLADVPVLDIPGFFDDINCFFPRGIYFRKKKLGDSY